MKDKYTVPLLSQTLTFFSLLKSWINQSRLCSPQWHHSSSRAFCHKWGASTWDLWILGRVCLPFGRRIFLPFGNGILFPLEFRFVFLKPRAPGERLAVTVSDCLCLGRGPAHESSDKSVGRSLSQISPVQCWCLRCWNWFSSDVQFLLIQVSP